MCIDHGTEAADIGLQAFLFDLGEPALCERYRRAVLQICAPGWHPAPLLAPLASRRLGRRFRHPRPLSACFGSSQIWQAEIEFFMIQPWIQHFILRHGNNVISSNTVEIIEPKIHPVLPGGTLAATVQWSSRDASQEFMYSPWYSLREMHLLPMCPSDRSIRVPSRFVAMSKQACPTR